MMRCAAKQSGFTLLELLLVVFLLGVLAMTTFAVVQEGDDQQRYDATRTYYQLIKKAVIGDATLTLNGETDVSGFVADMGRLPACVRELLEREACDGSELEPWTQDTETQVWSGWRGPYLPGMPESIGLAFRDGWKNTGGEAGSASPNPDMENYGWLFGTGAADDTACQDADVGQPVAGSLYVQSCGSDARVGAAEVGSYAEDYPAKLTATGLPPALVVAADHQVVLGAAWETVLVEIANDAGIPLDIAADSLRLSVNYPVTDSGTLPVCAHPASVDCDPEFAPFLSDTFPGFGWNSSTSTLSVAEPAEVTFPAGTTPVGAASSTFAVIQDGALTLDDGSRIYLAGCSALAPCEVITSENLTLDGNSRLTLPAGATMTLPAGHAGPVQFAASGLLKPYVDVPEGSAVTAAQVVTLPDATILTFNGDVALMPGSDSRVMVDVSSLPAQTEATVTASSAISMAGSQVSTASGAAFLVPPGSSLDTGTGTLTLGEGLALPAGQRSITVVCDQANNPAGDYRKLFDGVCSGTAGETATPVPVLLKVKPRANVLPPAPLRWQLR